MSQKITTIVNHRVRLQLKLKLSEYCFMDFLDYRKKNFPQEELKLYMFEQYFGMKPITTERVLARLYTKGMITKVGLVDSEGKPVLFWKTKQSINEKVQQQGTTLVPTEKWYNAFRKVKVKDTVTISKTIVIPTEEQVMEYFKSIPDLPYVYEALESHMRTKYHQWKDNGWRDGYNKPIINWKTTVRGIKHYLKPDWSKVPKEGTGVTVASSMPKKFKDEI